MATNLQLTYAIYEKDSNDIDRTLLALCSAGIRVVFNSINYQYACCIKLKLRCQSLLRNFNNTH